MFVFFHVTKETLIIISSRGLTNIYQNIMDRNYSISSLQNSDSQTGDGKVEGGSGGGGWEWSGRDYYN